MAVDQDRLAKEARAAFSEQDYEPLSSVPLTIWEKTFQSHREERERQEAYNKSLRGRISNRIRYLRGCLSDWIAPDGWNDYE